MTTPPDGGPAFQNNNMTNLEPPAEIIEAARQIHQWAELNGQTEYEIHGICSRKRVLTLEREVALLMGRLEQLQNDQDEGSAPSETAANKKDNQNEN